MLRAAAFCACFLAASGVAAQDGPRQLRAESAPASAITTPLEAADPEPDPAELRVGLVAGGVPFVCALAATIVTLVADPASTTAFAIDVPLLSIAVLSPAFAWAVHGEPTAAWLNPVLNLTFIGVGAGIAAIGAHEQGIGVDRLLLPAMSFAALASAAGTTILAASQSSVLGGERGSDPRVTSAVLAAMLGATAGALASVLAVGGADDPPWPEILLSLGGAIVAPPLVYLVQGELERAGISALLAVGSVALAALVGVVAAPFAEVEDPSAGFEELFAQGLTVGTAMFSILAQSLVLLPPSAQTPGRSASPPP